MRFKNSKYLLREKIWIFPLIGAFLSIILVFCPFSETYFFYGYSYFPGLGTIWKDGPLYLWMWGLCYADYGGYGKWVFLLVHKSGFYYVIIFILGMMITITTLLSASMIVLVSNDVRKGEITIFDAKDNWLDISIYNFILICIYTYYTLIVPNLQLSIAIFFLHILSFLLTLIPCLILIIIKIQIFRHDQDNEYETPFELEDEYL